MEYYNSDVCGYSIPAAEHSTITSWGKSEEGRAFGNMLKEFPSGLVAVVSDSYDIYNAVKNLWGDELKSQVLARDGTLVVRPDSGEDEEAVAED
jgi:nicotinamide phosphoribosyltransferase